ncbi:MAG: hypothetical protein JXA90_05300 [Planctomycetes bacterium]|nr:hypothetical protein [Planctomycetota bacterium]
MAGLAGGARAAQGSAQGGPTGPAGGQASGVRPQGSPEPVSFEGSRIRASGLEPGDVVGQFTEAGDSPEGTARISKSDGVARAVRALSDEIEKEPLPKEYEKQVRDYLELILEGGERRE